MTIANNVLSLRLPEHEKTELERLARRLGRTVSELAARMIVEGRRRAEFAWLDFRDTPVGRVACLQGTRLQVWWIARLAREFKGDARKVTTHLDLSPAQVKAALIYAKAFPDEIEAAIRDYESFSLEELKRQVPQVEVFEAGARKPRSRR
ncbi:MAG TPA: transcriptional regulator [Candidatus Binatia bacterium]|jgi:uncharacterized protein (DUF433 family)|nr:transcriptional regulator [Candidatus Binatia bacterium]